MPVQDEEQKPEDTNEIDNEDITKDWKVYRNEKYGYIIKYLPYLNTKNIEDYKSIIFENEENFITVRIIASNEANVIKIIETEFEERDKLAQQTKFF